MSENLNANAIPSVNTGVDIFSLGDALGQEQLRLQKAW
ncbi:hypothetical protein TUMEXPCC7403_23520 [Tumidithrix helvetica PCC 7403]